MAPLLTPYLLAAWLALCLGIGAFIGRKTVTRAHPERGSLLAGLRAGGLFFFGGLVHGTQSLFFAARRLYVRVRETRATAERG